MKKIIEDVLSRGELFNNLFHLKERGEKKSESEVEEVDKVSYDLFLQKMQTITTEKNEQQKEQNKAVPAIHSTTEFEIQEDDIQEEIKKAVPDTKIIMTQANSEIDFEEYVKERMRKEQQGKTQEKNPDIPVKKEKALPENVRKALAGEDVPLPVFDAETILRNLQQDIDNHRIAL